MKKHSFTLVSSKKIIDWLKNSLSGKTLWVIKKPNDEPLVSLPFWLVVIVSIITIQISFLIHMILIAIGYDIEISELADEIESETHEKKEESEEKM